MILTTVKLPVIPVIQNDKDIKTALDNLRAFFSEIDGKGGLVAAQDLLNMGIVKNVQGTLVKK